MQWRGKLKSFGVRFGVCFIILGGIYIAIFGFPLASHNKPNTPSAKILRLRSALDQTYIDASVIAHFKQNDITSYSTLSTVIGKFETDVKTLKTSLSQASKEIPSDRRKQITVVTNSEDQVIADFGARYNILQKPLAYNPESDLSSLDLDKDAANAAQRATAAQTGLQKAANDTTTANSSNALGVGTVGSNGTLLDEALKQTLLDEADCFGGLSTQLTAHQTVIAGQTRKTCIKNYPALRQKAIQNVAQGSFSSSYMKNLEQSVSPLLKQLSTLAASTAQKSSK